MHELLAKQLKMATAVDGQVDWQRFVQLVNQTYRDAQRRLVGCAGCDEVIERHRAERELRESERRFRDLAVSASDWFWETDADYRLTFVSDWIGELLGLKPNAVLGLDYFDIGLDEDPSLAAKHRRDIEARLPFRDLTFHVGPGNGGRDSRYIRISGIPIFEADGAFRGYRGMGADITREVTAEKRAAALRQEIEVRARTEEALRSSRERLKRVTDSLFEGVVVVNRDGNVQFANPSAKGLLGWDGQAGDIEGHPLDLILQVKEQGDVVAFEGSPWQEVLQGGVTLRNEDAVFAAAGGRTFSVAYACAALSDDDGRRSAIISFRDVGELKAAQREALQASRMASVGQLAAGIAHEINTPVQFIGDNLSFIGASLTKLLGLVEAARTVASEAAAHPAMANEVAQFELVLAAAKLPFLMRETEAAVAESLDGVKQIGRIVLSMKEFSHPGTVAKTMSDINRALESTIMVSRNEWKHSAEIERRFDPSLPAVLCHAGEINQVFLNLIINAAQALSSSGKELPGRIVISTSSTDQFVEIRIADTGLGVPETIKDKIFDPFFTTKDVGKGTGQGLAICRDVVVIKHGGTIDVEGREGEGAVFVVRLPIDGASHGVGSAE